MSDGEREGHYLSDHYGILSTEQGPARQRHEINVPKAENSALSRRVLLADKRSVTIVDTRGDKLFVPILSKSAFETIVSESQTKTRGRSKKLVKGTHFMPLDAVVLNAVSDSQ